MSKVKFKYGKIDFDAAVNLMDEDLREQIHHMGLPTDQEFMDAYCEAHLKKFGEEFIGINF